MNELGRRLLLINFVASSATLAIAGGASLWLLRLTSEEQVVAVAVSIGLLAVGYLVHLYLTRPLIPQMEWTGERDVGRALAVMRAFPVRAAKLSWYLWIALDVAGAFFFYVYFGSWQLDDRHLIVSLLVFASILAGGGIAFLLQFYAYKVALLSRMRQAGAEAARAGQLDGLHDQSIYGLRNKLVVSSLTLLAGALLFSVMFGYTRIAEGVQARLLGRAAGVMQRLAPEVDQLVAARQLGAAAERLRKTQLGAGGELMLLSADNEDVLGLGGGRYPLHRLAEFSAENWRSPFVVKTAAVGPSGYTLVAVFPWDLSRGDMSAASKSFFWLFLFVSVITILVATFSAREIAAPVKDIVYRTERMAGGDLNEPLELLSEDEVGEFSADLEQVRRYLRSVLADVETASRQIETLSNRVLQGAQSVAHASAEQSSRLATGMQAIERMSQGFDRISSGSLELTGRAADGGDSIQGLDLVVRDVDTSTDRMVERVETIRDVIDRMNRVAELIFANLGDLSRSIDVTVRNIRKFSDSIRRNEERVATGRALSTRMLESSSEGLQLTGQTVESVRAIDKSVENIGGIFDELIARLNDVGKLIGVINEVADDTKLLSLNAAIIAAQAGEQGRPFSVLAEKIKILADRTNTATGQIITMIDEVGDGSHQLTQGMDRVRKGVDVTREATRQAGERLGGIIESARLGFEGMAVVASTSARHVEEGQAVERSVVGLASAVEHIHGSVRNQRSRAAEVTAAMERVESGVRTLKTAARAQAEGGRALSGSIEQVVMMVSHLKKILLEQQSEMHRIQEAIGNIGSGAQANQGVAKQLQREAESLRRNAESFHRFLERFKIA